MQILRLLVVAALFTAGLCYPEEDDVVVLDPSNFDAFIAEKPLALVEFYAPWCGHCKALAPEWAKAAKRAKNLSPPVPLAKVDADAHKSLGEKFDVTGFPTIKWFMDGVASDYEGPREADDIIEEVAKKANYKPPTHLTDAKSAKDLVASSDCVLVGFFRNPVAASAAYKTYIKAAVELGSSGCTVAWSSSPAGAADPVAEALEMPAKEVPGLLLLRKGASASMKLPRNKADFTVHSISKFLESN